VYARPLPGFINDVNAAADDTSAVITWTTAAPADGMVLWGTDSSVANLSALSADLTTNHSITLSGLTPSTVYYYEVQSSTNGGTATSAIFTFTTTNYVTTNVLVDPAASWKYSTADLDGVNWTARGYDDSSWSDPSPAVLWADSRGENSSLASLATELPLDGSSDLPFVTYYFRTTFSITNIDPTTTLSISAFVDDGAVFYLNGTEIYRLRMPEAPTPIAYSTLATGSPCSGDATCSDDIMLPAAVVQALQPGLNVFAAEVHNYNLRSPDITFGASLIATTPRPKSQQLAITFSAGTITVTWGGSSLLQEADAPDGPWSNVAGATTGTLQIEPSARAHYFRLR
jgi:hypothetical protein